MLFIFSTNFIFVAIVFILQCYCLGSFSNYIICYFFVKLILDTPKKKEDSVGYFNHFRKDFIRPYGLAHDVQSFDEVTLTRTLNNFNCEFFTRPQIAISEFAETISANLKYIEQNLEILEPKSIEVFLKKAKKIEPYIAILDAKQPGETGKSIYYNLSIYENYIRHTI